MGVKRGGGSNNKIVFLDNNNNIFETLIYFPSDLNRKCLIM